MSARSRISREVSCSLMVLVLSTMMGASFA